MRKECDVLRDKISVIEEQMQRTREDHRRLTEETRQHYADVQRLREERERLRSQLSESQQQVRKFSANRGSPASSVGVSRLHSTNHRHVARNQRSIGVEDNGGVVGQTESERFEIRPRNLVTVCTVVLSQIKYMWSTHHFANREK